MDLSQFDTTQASEQGVVMPVINPLTRKPLLTDDGDAITITLLGMDSNVYRKHASATLKRRISPRGLNMNVDGMEDEAIELLVTCTTAWENIEIDGEKPPFSKQAVREAYGRFRWLREQADEFINDRANFLGKSLTTSSNTPTPNSSSRTRPASRNQPTSGN